MFILNKGRISLAFDVKIKGRETRIEFDRQRFYRDTGNLATSGITEINDEVYAELKKLDFFKEQFEKGDFEEVENPVVAGKDALKAKNVEIAKLKKELKKVQETDVQKALKAKDDTINTLKAQLESLTKKGKEATEATETTETTETTEAPAESEGF